MGSMLFGADSLLERNTLTVSVAADPDFPLSNLSDDRIFTKYKMGTAATELIIKTDAGVGIREFVSYTMIVGHDLSNPDGDGFGPVLVEKQNSEDDITYFGSFSVSPTDNKIIARASFTGGKLARFHRIRLTRGTAFKASIGILKLGTATRIGVGASVGFDPNQERVEGQFAGSRTGNLMDPIRVFSSRRARVNLNLVPGSIINDTTAPQPDPPTLEAGFRHFWDTHASKLRPFLFHWNIADFDQPGSFEKDAFFGVIDPAGGISRPLQTKLDSGFRDLRFTVIGLRE